MFDTLTEIGDVSQMLPTTSGIAEDINIFNDEVRHKSFKSVLESLEQNNLIIRAFC